MSVLNGVLVLHFVKLHTVWFQNSRRPQLRIEFNGDLHRRGTESNSVGLADKWIFNHILTGIE